MMDKTLKPAELTIAMGHAFKARRPLFIWGQPGIGKSDKVREFADKYFPLSEEQRSSGVVNHIDIRLSQMEPTDVRGIPVPVTDPETGTTTTVWAIPEMLPQDPNWKGVLMFDEMNSAMPVVLAAAYQIILDRQIGEYKIPEGAFICAAGNRDGDGGVTFDMPSPLRNRFMHVEMVPNLKDWIEDFAIPAMVSPDVIAFLKFAEKNFNTFDPTDPSPAFATPRTWHYVSDLINSNQDAPYDKTEKRVLFTTIGGTVGEGVAAEFRTFHDLTSKLPSPMEILSGQVKECKNKEISAMYSLSINLTFTLKKEWDKVAKSDDKKTTKAAWCQKADNFLTFIDHNFGDDNPELVIMAVKNAMKMGMVFRPDELSSFKAFTARHKGLIIAANNVSS